MSEMFKNEFSFEKRLSESTKILDKYENRIPVIITQSKECRLPPIDKNKYLIPFDLTIAQFLNVLRKRIKLDDSQSLYIYVNKSIMPATSATFTSIYDKHKDKDGFLYLIYCGENTFG
jgi:GABA(A) receptor-associated protein